MAIKITQRLNEDSIIHVLPTITNLPDPTYTHKETVRLEGGEVKFGKWRKYFNVFEKGFLLLYNSLFNVTNNTFFGRDSGDSRANIILAMFANVAEGDSGTNSINIWFAPPGPVGQAPDFNAATRYTWFDGRILPTPKPGLFKIETAGQMGAGVQLRAHSTVAPNDVAIVAEIDGTVKVYRAYETSPTVVLSWDANGNFKSIGQLESTLPNGSGISPLKVLSRTKVQNLTSERIEILPTASLPAASVDNDGRIIIEDSGVNSANLVIYKDGKRFKSTMFES